MLTTNQLHIDGRRHTLLPATTLEAARGEVLLVQADGQERRTALALALTGRMKPSTGEVALGHDDSMSGLRRRSAIVDAPEVNAPEHHLTVRSLASEDLALVPFKFRDRTRPTEWLRRNGFEDILPKWIEEVHPGRLLHLQLELALANKDVELVVVDSPDRHTADDDAWLPLLTRLAAGELGHGGKANARLRPLIVVAVVGNLPISWEGTTVIVREHPGKPQATEIDAVPVEPVDTVEPIDTATVAVPVSPSPLSDPRPQAASGLPEAASDDSDPTVDPGPDPTTGPDPDLTAPIPTAGTEATMEDTTTEEREGK